MIVARAVKNGMVLVVVCDVCEEDIITPGAKVGINDNQEIRKDWSIRCKACSEETNFKGASLGEALATLAANARVPYSEFIGTFRKAWDELH